MPLKKILLSRIVPSKCCPPNILSGSNPLRSSFESLIEGTNQRSRRAPNINAVMLEACEDLTKDDDFFLVRADKGGKFFLWSRIDFYFEANRQLSDDTTYEHQDRPTAAAQYAFLKLTKQSLLCAFFHLTLIFSLFLSKTMPQPKRRCIMAPSPRSRLLPQRQRSSTLKNIWRVEEWFTIDLNLFFLRSSYLRSLCSKLKILSLGKFILDNF